MVHARTNQRRSTMQDMHSVEHAHFPSQLTHRMDQDASNGRLRPTSRHVGRGSGKVDLGGDPARANRAARIALGPPSAHLRDDEVTRDFVQPVSGSASAWRDYARTLASLRPRAVVVFNGIFYPEALLRHEALTEGISVISHEVGLSPFRCFFPTRKLPFGRWISRANQGSSRIRIVSSRLVSGQPLPGRVQHGRDSLLGDD